MVVRHGFEVQLVYADSKLPMKESEKDGKSYVEAEPDADYFIAIRRIGWEGESVSSASSRNTELGKVEVLLYQAILTNDCSSSCSGYSTSFQTSLNHASDAVTDALKKKFVRSKQGSTVITSRQSNNNSNFTMSFGRGAFINKVTLNYCTALGLVHVGVLPKPPVWMLHRMKHPAPPGDCTAQFKKMKHPEKDKEIEYIDLTDEDVSEAFT